MDIGIRESKDSAKAATSDVDWDNAYDIMVKPNGIPLNTKFGSLQAYNQADIVNQKDCLLVSSQDAGGLSTVWGRACLPYTDVELAGWPVRNEDLQPYYHLSEQEMMSLHCANPSKSAFAYHSPTVKSLPVPKNIGFISKKLQEYFEVVSARIALNKNRVQSCTGCGHCLDDCPEDVLLDFSASINYSQSQPINSFLPVDGTSAPNRTHLQFYFYNEIFERVVFNRIPFLKHMRLALMSIFRHLGVVQGFMHSDLSARMTLRKAGNGGFELSVSKKAPKTMKIVCPILWRLFKAGLIPILPTLQIKLPGQSFHNGGSFPLQSAGDFLTT